MMATDSQRQMDNKVAEVWGNTSKPEQELQVQRPLRQRRVDITPDREQAASEAKREVNERLFRR